MNTEITKAVYIYPGWHKEPFRKNNKGEILNEWELVLNAKPYFEGHRQPRRPLHIYDDSLVQTSEWHISLAKKYKIDAFIYCFYWSFGKRFLYKPLDEAFLGCKANTEIKFAIMWANRMPRGILPVKNIKGPVIHPSRYVYTNEEDFLNLIKFAAGHYFSRPNYLKIDGRYIFLIFDSAFFLRDTTPEKAKEIIYNSRRWLLRNGYEDLYLIALNPAPQFMRAYKYAGFNAISHYVWLPDWKGEYLQNYEELIVKRASEWDYFSEQSELNYYPAVSNGWDATPRGIFRKDKIPKRYPYWPIVINESPEKFADFVKMAIEYNRENNKEKILFVTSMNEYSEGHYIEPDADFGEGFLEVIRDAV
ncbi:MAG: glycoside hydrolase family 99-like domain-containing protein [Deltaproteobacteria bacterium]|nr:glycoside hydrolase family 99-like domain-containing protein [Deltaproteobacteria bacterium]